MAATLALAVTVSVAGCQSPDLSLSEVLPVAVLDGGGPVEMELGRVYAVREGQALKMDVFRPAEAETPTAAVVLVPGGFFLWSDRHSMQAWAYDLAAHGYTAAAIDYRALLDGQGYPTPVADVLAAIRYVRDNAADLNVDADRVGLLGRSAGGYLVLLAGMPDDVSLFDPSWPQGQSADVRTVVAVYGPADFTVDERTADPWQVLLVTWFMGTPQSEAPPLWAEASPTSYARADGPPVLIIHGAHDQIVPVSQARSLARAMEAAGQPYEFLELPYGSHVVGSEWWQLASQLYRPHILRFLDEHLR